MGTKLSVSVEDKLNPEIAPRTDRPPTFDPLYGFPKGRKKRELKISWEEMNQWNMPKGQRDYCAHLLVPYFRCQRNRTPFAAHFCGELRHVHEKCQLEDFIIRLKEYEREKRLLKRKLRKEQAAASAAGLTTTATGVSE